MDAENIDEKIEETAAIPHRIVHIDLKGAPPKISYLLKLIPLFRQWGATGILIEYEDMFPFRDSLSMLSKPYAYTTDDLRSLQEVTKAEGMVYVPLLQSFGHVEFILKHQEYRYLREATMNPMSLCPTHKDSLPLIEKIVDQYMQEHNDLEYLHIGGDEVFCLGLCKECLETQQSNAKLFLSHMMPLIKLIEAKYPTIKIIIWDDMFRDFSVPDLEMLGPTVIPMVWSYVDDLTNQFPVNMWGRYGDVFDEIWIASSFKGSSGPVCDMVPIQHHVNNHLSWLSLIESLDSNIKNKINGLAVTGWSRYDHFATLCELLPVALPCLALCLQIFKEKRFTKQLHENVSKQIGYLSLIPFNNINTRYDITCGNFPGSELVMYMSQLELVKHQIMAAQERLDGWIDSWHVDVVKQINYGHLEYISSLLNRSISSYEAIRSPLLECLSYHFYEETIQEFVKVKVDSKLKKAMDLLTKVQSVESICCRQ